MRVSRPERNPKVQVEGLVQALLEPLGRKRRQELLGLLVTQVPRETKQAQSG